MLFKSIFITSTTVLILTFFTSCGSSSPSERNSNSDQESAPEAVMGRMELDPTLSSATWERTLDQKATTQKVKLFGQMVDVELGAVKMNTNGTVALQSGTLSTNNDEPIEATTVFDMTSFKIAQEKGNGLFDIQQYPSSALKMSDFIADSTGFTTKGELTIQGTSAPVDVKLVEIKNERARHLKGSLKINTLDFPLRDQVTTKDINTDEIVVSFDLIYKSQ